MCHENRNIGCIRANDARQEACSEEQICQCHGDSGHHPCATDGGCVDFSQAVREPSQCTPEQIRRCHGGGDHPCE